MSTAAYFERVERPYPRLHLKADNQSAEWHHRSGYWVGPAGIVMIATWSGRHRGTRMETVQGGYTYVRHWDRCFGDRTLSRLAREMAEHYTL